MPRITTLESWRSRMAQEDDLPLGFLMAWLKHESYGNPCSTGVIRNGVVVEAGIGQLYYPDDARFGASLSEVRTTCAGNTQDETRALTADEREEFQAKPFIRYVRDKVGKTEAALAKVGANWPRSSADFWMFVKLYHALPGINNILFPAFARVHGRAPHSFAEFSSWCIGLSPAAVQGYVDGGHSWVKSYKSEFPRLFANATKTGAAAGPVLANSPELALYAIPGLGLLLKLWSRVKGGG